jgi:ribonuclease HI
LNLRLPEVTVVSDGSCRQTRNGGYAALLQCDDVFHVVYGNSAETTNNRMELMAAISGLELLQTTCRVRIVSDSRYVVNGLKFLSTWIRNGWRTQQGKPVANQDLWERLHAQMCRHSISPVWVKGHHECAENKLVDWFASMASIPVGSAT